jgi:hypothetical protein
MVGQLCNALPPHQIMVVGMIQKHGNQSRMILWSILYASLLASQELLKWPLVRFWNASQGSITSADARSVLKGLECYHQYGISGFLSPEILTSCQSSNIYGTTFGFFSTLFGITAEATPIFTWLGILGIAAIFGYLQASSSVSNTKTLTWVFPFLALSPPVHFLLERANFDTLVFFLVFLGSIQVFRKRFKFAALLFAASALLKFYSIFSVGAVLAWVRTKSQFWTIVLVQVVLGALLSYELLARRQSTRLIPSEGGGSFGLTVLPLIWNIGVDRIGLPGPIHPDAVALVGAAIFIPYLVLVIIVQSRTKFLTPKVAEDSHGKVWGIFGITSGVVFASCFIAGANFDYRMVFLIPFGVWILSRLAFNTLNSKIFAATLLGSVWISFIPGPIQPLGDLLIAFWAAIAIVSVIEELKLVYQRFNSNYSVTLAR